MTRTHENKCEDSPAQVDLNMGETLREAVWQASDQGRLTFGMQDCARLLEIDPFNTMLCVVPASPTGVTDVSVQIKHMLIEAFCTEYDIRMVKVDSADKLTKVILGRDEAVDNASHAKRPATAALPTDSVDCLLIQYPDEDPSKEDEMIAEYYKNCLFAEDDLHSCYISLPD